MDNVKIEIYQQDWIPGFAAFRDDHSLEASGKAHVVLNLAAFLSTVATEELTKEELPYAIAECLMHEVIHVLEAWARIEFNEKKVDELIIKYYQHTQYKEEEKNNGK